MGWDIYSLAFSPNDIMIGSLVAQAIKNLPAMQETQVPSMDLEDSLKKAMATHSSMLAWKIPWMEQPERLQCRGHRASDMTEQLTLSIGMI